MKQASRIQRQMEQAQEDLSDRTVDASSGGGAVKITAKCDGTLKTITIDPESVDKEDISLLEDLVLTAANKALEEAKEISNDEMGKLTSGLKIPGLV
jgi:DNA-binding YbaB/EbfC family protein|tara:strand:+ start:105 stop:395 length:291 start_codon:yes stop_codon:yes gene_type:complete